MRFIVVAYLYELGQDMGVKFHSGAGDIFQLCSVELRAQEYLSHAISGHHCSQFQSQWFSSKR